MLLLAIVVVTACALAMWGPGTHLEFEHRVYRRRHERLPAEVAALIEEHRSAWQYGHIAADIINFKSLGGPYSHCHRWGILDEMRALATTDAERAFVFGYSAHLAADTIAHNHFVPYHLARFARTQGLGHLYWELNADRFVPEERWEVVTRLKADPELTQLDELVNRTVPKKALSMTTNKLIFNHVLLVSERRRWRDHVLRLHPLTSVDLSRGFLDLFRDAALERIFLVLQPRGLAHIEHVDANGKAAQKRAMATRKKLVERYLNPRGARNGECEAQAAEFLVGMDTPPPKTAA